MCDECNYCTGQTLDSPSWLYNGIQPDFSGEVILRATFHRAWERFTLITTIIGETQGRIVAVILYFTLLLPFALVARGKDTLRRHESARWLEHPPLPTDLDSARRQG